MKQLPKNLADAQGVLVDEYAEFVGDHLKQIQEKLRKSGEARLAFTVAIKEADDGRYEVKLKGVCTIPHIGDGRKLLFEEGQLRML